jgi:hypothetical protein
MGANQNSLQDHIAINKLLVLRIGLGHLQRTKIRIEKRKAFTDASPPKIGDGEKSRPGNKVSEDRDLGPKPKTIVGENSILCSNSTVGTKCEPNPQSRPKNRGNQDALPRAGTRNQEIRTRRRTS